MQAIILAAGMGKRLKDLTQDNTKCMVKVNGVPMINRTLSQLDQHHLSQIIIVVGYEGQKLMEHINALDTRTPIIFIDNPIYDKTNNIYSLSLAKDYMLKEDTLLLESDIIFEDSVLKTLVEDPRDSVALVAKYEAWMDGTCVQLSEDDDIEAMIPGSKFQFGHSEGYYKTVNLYKFGAEFSRTHYVPFLEAYTKALGNNEYYEQVLKVIVTLDDPGIKACRLGEDQLWYEIDDIQDLDIAESMFAPREERMKLLQKRFGGYWRYPKLVDFCYLVNSYYPPQKLLDEIKANFEALVCQYPSGMAVNSLLAAKNFGVRQEHILVGNGAAELIKSLMEELEGSCGFIRPTFEEFPNRYPEQERVVYTPDNDNFSYDADDIIGFFTGKGIRNLLVINPDNPSGNYISREGILRIADWCKEQEIQLIVDESFLDFADEKDATLIDEEILAAYPDMVVMKSISKSYGIPGLRLGIAVSRNEELIGKMKRDVAIWNINSLGEFYLQIAEKYKKQYVAALEKFRAERSRFVGELENIKGLRVIPSQANYLMIELTGGMTAEKLTEDLYNDYNLLIKDLSKKVVKDGKQFIRVAVRDEHDDDLLVTALREIVR